MTQTISLINGPTGTSTVHMPTRDVFQFKTKKKELKTYKVRAHHEGCGGELVCTGHGVTAGSTSWEHRCDKCGAIGWVADVSYPAIAYDE